MTRKNWRGEDYLRTEDLQRFEDKPNFNELDAYKGMTEEQAKELADTTKRSKDNASAISATNKKVDTNTGNIATNADNIATNKKSIADNKASIQANSGAIASNKTAIETNKTLTDKSLEDVQSSVTKLDKEVIKNITFGKETFFPDENGNVELKFADQEQENQHILAQGSLQAFRELKYDLRDDIVCSVSAPPLAIKLVDTIDQFRGIGIEYKLKSYISGSAPRGFEDFPKNAYLEQAVESDGVRGLDSSKVYFKIQEEVTDMRFTKEELKTQASNVYALSKVDGEFVRTNGTTFIPHYEINDNFGKGKYPFYQNEAIVFENGGYVQYLTGITSDYPSLKVNAGNWDKDRFRYAHRKGATPHEWLNISASTIGVLANVTGDYLNVSPIPMAFAESDQGRNSKISAVVVVPVITKIYGYF